MELEKRIPAGRIVNTHGLRGEVKIESWLDSPDFLAGFHTLYLEEKPLRVRAARTYQNRFVIAALAGVEDVNAAMALKGRQVYIDRADAHLPEGAYFLADILGSRVETEQGELLGILEDILERPANDVYVVRGGGRERLIPAVPEFILRTDAAERRITVRLIEGM